jgi:putative SOS response-associated peptidase YedK
MCGRFDRHSSLNDFAQVVDGLSVEVSEDLPPSYNVAPSQRALVVRNTSKGRAASALAWGLLPSWVKDSKKNRPINARSETVNERPMFRGPFRSQRCLVLCDGYYEWQKQATGSKQPYYFQRPGAIPFALAGLWERNDHLDTEPLETFCILTTKASSEVDCIHRRMPICLARDAHEDWLDSMVGDVKFLSQLMTSINNDWVFYPVSRYVNNPRNSSNRCVEPMLAVERL